MFNNLTDKLEKVFKKLRSFGKLDENNIKDGLREVRMVLLEADVNFKVVKDFIEKVRLRAIGKEVMTSLTPGQQVIKIVHDEMIHLLGGEKEGISLTPKPVIIMMVGLQGSGKTTSAGKIAFWLKNNNKNKILLIAADTYRPAAQEQLIVLGGELGMEVFTLKGQDASPLTISIEGVKKGHNENFDAIIIDTAGRLQIDDTMMQEVISIREKCSPTEILLVVDAMTGQEAVNVAHTFNQQVGIDGILLTKLDGDVRGGAALSAKSVTGKPIKFVGTGEKIADLELFYPDRMASRILGMGDVLTLIEKAKDSFEKESVLNLQKKMKNDSFTLEDFLTQLRQIKKMGSLEKLMGMIPGLNKMKDKTPDDSQLVKTEAIIHSMTKAERINHTIINGSRRIRIAKGSGTSVSDVNKLLKQFSQMKKMMKKFTKQFSKKNFSLPKGAFPNFM